MLRWIAFNLRYLVNPVWDTQISPPELFEFIASHPPGNALDLGCGTGTNLVTLAQAGWKITGVEYVWMTVRKARKRLKRSGIKGEVFCRDVVDIDFLEGKFDLILDIGCYHGLLADQKQRYQDNLSRLLNKNGSFLIYAYLKNEAGNFGFDENDFLTLRDRLKLIWRRDGLGGLDCPTAWMQFDWK